MIRIVDDLLKHNQLARRALWLMERAGRRRGTRTLRKAIRAFDEVLDVMSPDHPDRPSCLANLAGGHVLLFRRTGDADVVDDLVRVHGSLVDAVTEQHPERARYRGNLRTFLVDLARNSPGPGLLARATPLAREAVVDPSPAAVTAFREVLSLCLGELSRSTGDPDVLAELVALDRRRVAETAVDDPDLGALLSDLGAGLRDLALATNRPELLDEAVATGRRAVAVCPPGHDHEAACLRSLGNSVHARYGVLDRSIAALEESVALGRRAVAVADRSQRSSCLTALGLALRSHYQATADLELLREAVHVCRDAVSASGPDPVDRAPCLVNLSVAEMELFKRTGRPGSIDAAVRACDEAVRLSVPGSAHHAARLGNLANALQIASLSGPVPADAEQAPPDPAPFREAVRVARTAAEATAPGSGPAGGRLSNLSLIARTLYEVTGDETALEEAVRAGRRAVAVAPVGSEVRELAVLSLIRALAPVRDPGIVDEIREHCTELDDDGVAPRTRVVAHLFLGRAAMAAEKRRPDVALAAYEYAVTRLPGIAPRRLRRADREHGLGELAGLPAEAASVALEAGRPEYAVQLLEHSRGVLLREALDGRRELDLLREADPALAEEFELLRDLLGASDLAGLDLYESGQGAAPPHDGRRDRHLEVVARWEALIDRIRTRAGLEEFLRPAEIGPWTSSPVDEPIVVVTAGPHRCDALLVVGDEPVRTVRLDCTYDELRTRADAFRLPAGTDVERRMLDDLAWLWDHVTGPVLAELDLSPPVRPGRSDLPAIRWCLVGIASFLPLHAAGHHRRPGTGPSVMDHVVSSYTPTIDALRSGRAAGTGHRASAGEDVLAVEMSTTPGATALPGARAEIERITDILPATTVLSGPDATREAVLDALATHRFAHFACHATYDPVTPALSRLVLHDHRTAPLTVADLAALSLPDAGLAFLSACSTATSSDRLADEAVHIATAFRIAGFHQVVGTLWPVADTAARRIAQGFYAELASTTEADPAARALHRAVLALRSDQPTTPSRWAAHVLVG